MGEIVLHHYPQSPFAEKVRIALGIKGLAWRSVIIPIIMPKPDLILLTGGYRKTPVLQIGADIYCDSQCIVRELERRFPQPSIYRGTDAGAATALAFWSDRTLFTPVVSMVFGLRPEAMPEGFAEDRSRMIGREINVQRLQAAVPALLEQLRPPFSWLEAMLSDGRAFLAGAHPTLIDCSVYQLCWFIRVNVGPETAPLSELPNLRAWAERMEKIGHGEPSAMTSQAALEIARAAAPQAVERYDANDPCGRRPGMRVKVTPDDIGRDPVIGELIASSPDEIVIRRHDPQVGEIAVHFPRAGFVLEPAP